MRRIVVIVALAVVALMLVGSASVATPAREGAISIGDKLYLYVETPGAGFPKSHHVSLWQETNGVGASCAQVLNGCHMVPVPTGGYSGLQVSSSSCAPTADKRLQQIS
ncbi:MAG: hypothetical protein HY775_03555 [Acidobacteria bacterium]|nr:hypothetical protein [Acidobacteriota bacterium]